MSLELFDFIGVGIGPFNLGLGALTSQLGGMKGKLLEQKPEFDWHGGMLLDHSYLQVPFFADLVTMADPTHPLSYLNYLHEVGRLYKFYFYETFQIPRAEYNEYCKWASQKISSCEFGRRVSEVTFMQEQNEFLLKATNLEGQEFTYRAKNLVMGVGTAPLIPQCFADHLGERVFHNAMFTLQKSQLKACDNITVVGAGQSAAECVLDLLNDQAFDATKIHWITKDPGFLPMEYTKLGLEHFSPEYTDFFYGLSQDKKDQLLSRQDFLYKGISADTIGAIYDSLYEKTIGGKASPVSFHAHQEVGKVQVEGQAGLSLTTKHCITGEEKQTLTHGVILATGYGPKPPEFLLNLDPALDAKGRIQVSRNYQLQWPHQDQANIFIQNGELHTHGVGAPDLGLGAYRNSVIINQLAGREIFKVRERNVFQGFN